MNAPVHRLAPSALESERTNSIEDCLDEAQEALAIAGQMDCRGDREALRLWIRQVQDWLDEAERLAR